MPVITVCLSKSGEEISKGYAVCSDKDQPRKKIGRAIASGRAAKAMRIKECRPYSLYDPILNEFERSILNRSEEGHDV